MTETKNIRNKNKRLFYEIKRSEGTFIFKIINFSIRLDLIQF